MVRLAPDRAKRMSEDSAANLAGTGRAQRPGTGGQGRAGGEDVIDDHNSPRRWPEAAHDRCRDQPGGAIAAHLAWSVAANEAGRALEPDARGEGRGEQLGGVEASSSSPCRRRRHGDDDRSARRRRGASRHRLRGDGGEGQTGLKLQRRDQAPSHSLIRRGETDGTEVRHMCVAAAGACELALATACTRWRRPGTVERRLRSAAGTEAPPAPGCSHASRSRQRGGRGARVARVWVGSVRPCDVSDRKSSAGRYGTVRGRARARVEIGFRLSELNLHRAGGQPVALQAPARALYGGP